MPSFIDVVNGADAAAPTIQQVIDALKGTAGKGIPLSPTAVNDAINFALAVKNTDAGASKAAIFYKADGTVLLQIDKNGVIASPDGAAAAPIVTTTGLQTLTNKTLTTPTIASFTNATHNHSNAAGGGGVTLPASSTITTPVLTDPQVGNAVATGLVPYRGTATQTLPAPGTMGRARFYKAYGGALIVNSNSGSQQVNPGASAAAATLTLADGDSVTFYDDGTYWVAC